VGRFQFRAALSAPAFSIAAGRRKHRDTRCPIPAILASDEAITIRLVRGSALISPRSSDLTFREAIR
jgi:hypothetical protein